MATAKEKILNHFRVHVPEMLDFYVLVCPGAPVTVRSQQIRALNLAWALDQNRQIADKSIAVIGAGAAGLTFAAAAAVLGAERVTVFEKSSQLLDVQHGSWHRPLHPEIFTWPNPTAWRPVSHLPLFGWTTGRAHDVAEEIIAKFELICTKVNAEAEAQRKKVPKEAEAQVRKKLEIVYSKRATVNRAGKVIVDGEEKEKFSVVVLAVGFGVEANPFNLPWNSYWRVDPLDQSLLGELRPGPRTAVVGVGDGALIEIVRSCVQAYDLGALLDRVLTATLGDEKLRKRILEIESKKNDDLLQDYQDLDTDSARKVRGILWDARRKDAVVTWLINKEKGQAFSHPSLPIHRFLVGQLLRLSEKQLELKPHYDVKVTDVMRGDGVYVVRFLEGKDTVLRECDHAIVRYGAQKEPSCSVLKSIVEALADTPEQTILRRIAKHYKTLEGQHKWIKSECVSQKWDPGFEKRFEAYDYRNLDKKPELHAEVVEVFDDQAKRPKRPIIYRIRIWLEDVPDSLKKVTYDLHPDLKTVVSREALKPEYQQWINTFGDYRIRVRTNIGWSWDLGLVTEALGRERAKNPKVDSFIETLTEQRKQRDEELNKRRESESRAAPGI